MVCNVGLADKVVRVLLGVGLVVAGMILGNVLIGALAIVPVGTAVFGVCPLYSLLGINTGCRVGR